MNNIESLLKDRVLLLDGSMGVMIQRLGLDEAGFRGSRFASHPLNLAGDNDLLVLTRPDLVAGIHRAYLDAGADIIETNSFNANAISQAEFGLESIVEEINTEAAKLARKVADEFEACHPGQKKFVAGSIGPTAVAASLSSDVNDPSKRDVAFDRLREVFFEQSAALLAGGVDMLLIETVFDALNAKAALIGARDAMDAADREVPVMLSITLSDASGRMLSGHSIEAFLAATSFAGPFAVGMNCSMGPEEMLPALRRLSTISPYPTIVYPNAGLPDECGCYSSTPESFTLAVDRMLSEGLINIVGGCCGTMPEHISHLRRLIDKGVKPRKAGRSLTPWLAGLDSFDDNRGFINVGERCNVAGSRKFLRLIKEGDLDQACAIARKQVEDGAMILDINMDDALLDTRRMMVRFVRMLGADPLTASVPWMIDTSDFEVAESALKEISGKAIINSISLKKGEEEFIRQAGVIKRYGAAVVVMAFDEEGQAVTLGRKIAVCQRAFDILTNRVGLHPRDIIFDPNILTVATGIAEHNAYAAEYIEAVRWITHNLKGAKTSGGVSNLSFAFRGNNFIRQALHAVFLYHAIEAGLSMAIIDPGSKVTYGDIDKELLAVLEDVVLNRDAEASERLIEMAAEYASSQQMATGSEEVQRPAEVNERLIQALMKGDDSNLEDDLKEALDSGHSASDIVEKTLMDGMERVGKLFETGKMFLPQVVKSARTMHKAVGYLSPILESANDNKGKKFRGRFLLATVKGDVHDIGKNIVGVVLRCNNFDVIDLGVQVDSTTIIDAVRKYNPDFIGLSGLISPSLDEMVITVRALREAGISIPVFVGGAATSKLHTALRIAPEYGGPVIRVNDAAQDPLMASKLLSDPVMAAEEIAAANRSIVESYTASKTVGQGKPLTVDWEAESLKKPAFMDGCINGTLSVEEVRPFINWRYFYNCWKVKPGSPESESLLHDAEKMLDLFQKESLPYSVAFYEAYSQGDSIVIDGPGNDITVLPTPRQKSASSEGVSLSLSDFVAPVGHGDHIGAFMVTIGDRLREMVKKAGQDGDDYHLIMAQSVCDRLVESASELLHYKVRSKLWGYAPDEVCDIDAISHGRYSGIRPAVGYPSLPDQRLMFKLESLVDRNYLKVEITENGALIPSSTVAGFYFASPHSRYFSV